MMGGPAFIFLILVGVALDRLWLNRHAAADWLLATFDPPERPRRAVAPARSCIRVLPPVGGDDEGPWVA